MTRDEASAARARTMAHMRKLLTTAVAAAGCSHEPVNTITLEPQAQAASASVAATATQSAKPVEDEQDRAQLTRHPLMGHDPVPPPSYCPSLGTAATTLAAIKRDAAGLVVEITVTLPANHPTQATFSSQSASSPQPMVWGGQLVSVSYQPKVAVIRIKPDGSIPGAVQAQLSLACTGGAGSIQVRAKFDLPMRDGAKVTIPYSVSY